MEPYLYTSEDPPVHTPGQVITDKIVYSFSTVWILGYQLFPKPKWRTISGILVCAVC